MKKSLLAAALAVFAAGSVSAATVYDKDGTSLGIGGRVQSVWYSVHTGENSDNDNTVKSTARFSLEGRTQLSSFATGFSFAEWDLSGGESDGEVGSREMYVGVDFGDFGIVTVGRTYDAVKSVVETTDIFEDWGCVGQVGCDDWRSGTIRYNWSGYGFDAAISYGAAVDEATVAGTKVWGDDGFEDADMNINNSFSAMAGYTSPDVLFGPIAVKAGYAYIKAQNGKDGKSALFADPDTGYALYYRNMKEFSAALSWGTADAGFYTALMFDQRRFSLDSNVEGFGGEHHYTVKGVEYVVSYALDCGLSAALGYEFSETSVDGGAISVLGEDVAAEAITRKIPLYINYSANENFNVWAEAQFDVGSDDGVDDESLYSVGARYTF